ERKLKRWRRAWKDALIAEHNPEWRDMGADMPL
ncbi:MAG: excinuclease ABC subunit C, partial [Rhodobacterales bacterium CG18_big_fil_WC_8_21_14_2_50_71_9]